MGLQSPVNQNILLQDDWFLSCTMQLNRSLSLWIFNSDDDKARWWWGRRGREWLQNDLHFVNSTGTSRTLMDFLKHFQGIHMLSLAGRKVEGYLPNVFLMHGVNYITPCIFLLQSQLFKKHYFLPLHLTGMNWMWSHLFNVSSFGFSVVVVCWSGVWIFS